jgi:hypothetical protein
MKSLDQITTAVALDDRVLKEVIPGITDRLSSQLKQATGIDGFLFPDLMSALSTGFYQFKPSLVRRTLKSQGWVSVCKMIPGRKDRIQVFVNKSEVL